MSKGRIPQTIRFENDTFKKLEELANNDHTSVNSIVNRIVDEYFDKKDITIKKSLSELSPEYQAAFLEKTDDELIKMILDELKNLQVRIDELEKKRKID